MEVFSFVLELEKKWTIIPKQQLKTVKNILLEDIKSRNQNIENYHTVWEKFKNEKKDIFELATLKDLLYHNEKGDIDYFIFQRNQTAIHNTKNLTVQVIVITDLEINPSLSEVIKDIQSLVSLKVLNLSDKQLQIYPIDPETNDIEDVAINITTKISKRSLETSEVLSLLVGIVFGTMGSLEFFLEPDGNEQLKEWLGKFFLTGIIMTVIPIFKLAYNWWKNDYSVKIKSAQNRESKYKKPPAEETYNVPKIDN